jgi:hypothetical protein
MNEKMKELDLKLAELRKYYYSNNKPVEGYFIDRLYNKLQNDIVMINKDIKELELYFEALLGDTYE